MVLVEALGCVLDGGEQKPPTPALDRYTTLDGDAFNAEMMARLTHSEAGGERRACTPSEVLAAYIAGAERAQALAARFDPETLRRPGELPWYGAEYAIDDYIVYAFYGHKREHCAQIAVFRDGL